MMRCCPNCARPLQTSLTSCQCGWSIYTKKPKEPKA